MLANPPRPPDLDMFHGMIWGEARALLEGTRDAIRLAMKENPRMPHDAHVWTWGKNFDLVMVDRTIELHKPIQGYKVFTFIVLGNQPSNIATYAEASPASMVMAIYFPDGMGRLMKAIGHRGAVVRDWHNVPVTFDKILDKNFDDEWVLYFAYNIAHEFTHVLDFSRRTKSKKIKDSPESYYNNELEFFAYSNQFLIGVLIHWGLFSGFTNKAQRIKAALDVTPDFKFTFANWTEANQRRFMQWLYGQVERYIAKGTLPAVGERKK